TWPLVPIFANVRADAPEGSAHGSRSEHATSNTQRDRPMNPPAKRRRVAVTGLGVLAPNGVGQEEFWSSLIAGKSSIDYITSFDVSAFPSKVAGQIKSFSPRDFLSARIARTAARFSQFAIAATRLALEDAKLALDSSLASMTAVCYGTSVTGV